MTPTLWFWSDHPGAARVRRIFLFAIAAFAFMAVYVVVSTSYIEIRTHGSLAPILLVNQVSVFAFAGIVLALVLRKAFTEVASAYGRVERAVKHMSDNFHIVDKDWKLTFVNNQFATLLGTPPENVVGKSLWDIVPASIQPELRARYADILNTGKPLHLEIFGQETGVWSDIRAYPDVEGIAVLFQDITERKRAETQMEQRNRRLQSLLDTAMDGIIAMDAKQNITLFNPAAEKIFQITRADILGKSITKLMPLRFQPHHAGYVDTFSATATTSRRMGNLGEVYGLRADGTEFPMEVSISKTGEGDDRIYTAIIRDITEKKRAQQKLDQKIWQQAALAQFSMNSITNAPQDDPAKIAARLACDNLDADYCTIADVDPHGEITIISAHGWIPAKTTFTLSQLSPDALVPRLANIDEIVRFGDISQEPSLQSDDVLHALNVRSGLGIRVRFADGHAGMFFVLSKALRSFSDDDAEFLRTLSNIVSRVLESEAVMKRLRLRDRALEAITQGITITDETNLNRPIIYTNPAFSKMIGYSVKEIVGSSPTHFLAPDAPAGVQDHFSLLRAKQSAGSLDSRTRRRDGSSFIDHLTVSPILNDAGELVHYVTVHEDVTEARQRDAQLHEAQKMETVGQLTGGVAHDFNNLLTVVRANAEDMRDDIKHSPELQEQLDMILLAADRGAALIRQMMAFARKQELKPENIDLNEMLNSFVKLVRRTLQENIALDVKCAPNIPLIHVDAARLETAILNMILNARDAMPKGGRIILETSIAALDKAYTLENPSARPGTYVMLAISDDGVGMSKEASEKAFEPFFTTKEVGQGTGLGLSMVYGFLRQSGGHAKIYSELGIGTTVRVYLPIVTGELKTSETNIPGVNAIPKGAGAVLVVEDDDLVRKSVSGRLARMGYAVTTAANATVALSLLDKTPGFDLVFTDVVMPGDMTGADLAREVKQRWPHIKILMTSGYTAASVLGKIKMPPDIPMLSKPYTIEQLVDALGNILGKPAV